MALESLQHAEGRGAIRAGAEGRWGGDRRPRPKSAQPGLPFRERGRSVHRPVHLALSSQPPKPRPGPHHPPRSSRRPSWPGPLGLAVTTSPASTGPHGSLVPSQTAAGTQGQCLSGKQGRPRPAQRTPLAFTESMCPVSAARPPPIKVSVCAANLLLEHTHAAPVGVFSRGTTRISGSLSCGAREVRSPCACPVIARSGPCQLQRLSRSPTFHLEV